MDGRVPGGSSGAAFAARVVAEYARATRAPRLIPISRAHVDSCLYQGRSSLDFARRLTDGGARVSVPTSLNVGLVDLMHPELNRAEPAQLDNGRELMRLYESMGCTPSWTCAPYQLADRPAFGEHVAWAESNAIVFINSVVGARTDRYGDLIDICAAIVGEVPDRGLHRTENRRGQVVFEVGALSREWQTGELLWPILGLAIGSLCGDRVPVIDGLLGSASEDSLKALGAAAASSGSIALFHAVGITPEAPTRDAALQGERPERVVELTDDSLAETRRRLSDTMPGTLAAVSVGTPHFSVSEFARLLPLIDGQRRSAGVEFLISTSRAVLREVQERGWTARLDEFGVQIVVDTCTYFTPIARARRGEVVMTNSAKWAYYAPGNLGYRVVFATLADCVRSAVTGRAHVTEIAST